MDKTVRYKLNDKQIKIAVSLYRHLIWADNLRKQFESVLARDRAELDRHLQTKRIVFDPKLLESEMYSSLWLGCLYSVIEGWPNLKVDASRITQLLKTRYKKKLFGFRNAVIHPVDYDDARFHALVAEGQKSIDWAREITNEFKVFLSQFWCFQAKSKRVKAKNYPTQRAANLGYAPTPSG